MSDDIDMTDVEQEPQQPPSFIRWVAELVFMLALAFALALGIRTYVVMPYTIPTGSMIPTIEIGERVLANRFIYRFQDPEPGDVVVLDDPMGGSIPLIKRVIAVGRQEVDINDDQVYIDGVPLDEAYTYGAPTEMGDVALPLVVPEGQLWLMGDNRTNSTDSRWFGPQPVDNVRGEAFLRIWPLTRIARL
jgi:signal peptidase I